MIHQNGFKSPATEQSHPSSALDVSSRSIQEQQLRGGKSAYADYYAGMDKTMAQKIALCAAFLPDSGLIADMGSGSGAGSAALASLYPAVHVVGVDISVQSIEHSRGAYKLPNLSFKEGDISLDVFPPNSLDGILNSSVIHHVTSFGDPAFDVAHVYRLLDSQIEQQKVGQPLIIRDFVIPSGPEIVYVEFSNEDGAASGSIVKVSTAEAFRQFCAEFRSSLHPQGGVPYEQVDGTRPGFDRFKVGLRDAAEFILRKDYRKTEENWAVELKEEYTYFSQQDFVSALAGRGNRVLHAEYVRNPWIVKNRFEGKVFLESLDGVQLEHIPTNFFIVGRKVAPNEPVSISEVSTTEQGRFSFCSMRLFEHVDTGSRMELVQRPFPVIDVLPYIETQSGMYVVAREDYQRPVLRASTDSPNLTDAFVSGFTVEPLSVEEKGDRSEEVRQLLVRHGINPVGAIEEPSVGEFFSSPGGVDEFLTTVPVRLDVEDVADLSGLRDANKGVRLLEARQLLRTCQVGGVLDNRLEQGIYAMLVGKREVGPWIGETISLEVSPHSPKQQSFVDLIEKRAVGSVFLECDPDERAGFFSLRRGEFELLDGNGGVQGKVAREYVTGNKQSDNTLAVLPLWRTESGVYIGLEERELPAPQLYTGDARIITAPAFRMPKGADTFAHAASVASEKLQEFHGVHVLGVQRLGGRYFSSPGVTPESVYPAIAEVVPGSGGGSLYWVQLDDALANHRLIQDGHLRTLLFRTAHALGVIDS